MAAVPISAQSVKSKLFIMLKEEIEKHKIAAKKLGLIKNKAFELIKKNLGKISEYDVQDFISSEFKKQGLVTEKNWPIQIVAVNQNSANPHYYPPKSNSKIIEENDLILIDIWARLNEDRSPFADITWVAYSGEKIPFRIKEIFKNVIEARDNTLKFIRKELKNKRLPKLKNVDKAARDHFRKSGLDKFFIHSTGHSLGFSYCHGNYFYFSKKSKANFKLEIPFTIEPGLYFKNKFGIRSEIDCYVTKDFKLVITSGIQNKIIKI